MTKTEILNYLELIESELTDAYNVTPDTSENSDTLYYIDNTKDLVNELMDNINGKFENRPFTKEEMETQLYNSVPPSTSMTPVEGNEPMGPDGLPLNYPYHNDGEGRLKGNN